VYLTEAVPATGEAPGQYRELLLLAFSAAELERLYYDLFEGPRGPPARAAARARRSRPGRRSGTPAG
jgi:hypothetical protein